MDGSILSTVSRLAAESELDRSSFGTNCTRQLLEIEEVLGVCHCCVEVLLSVQPSGLSTTTNTAFGWIIFRYYLGHAIKAAHLIAAPYCLSIASTLRL